MVSGAYSSIFIATPLLAQLKEREPDMKKLAARVRARRAKEADKKRVAATAEVLAYASERRQRPRTSLRQPNRATLNSPRRLRLQETAASSGSVRST